MLAVLFTKQERRFSASVLRDGLGRAAKPKLVNTSYYVNDHISVVVCINTYILEDRMVA